MCALPVQTLSPPSSPCAKVAVDVPRTAPSVPFFHEQIIQQSLERMLYIWGIRWGVLRCPILNPSLLPVSCQSMSPQKPQCNVALPTSIHIGPASGDVQSKAQFGYTRIL
jgi:hypothetical protein